MAKIGGFHVGPLHLAAQIGVCVIAAMTLGFDATVPVPSGMPWWRLDWRVSREVHDLVKTEAQTVAPSRQAVANAPSNGECRASSSANVQSGPGPNYAYLRVITRDHVLRVTGKSVDSAGLSWTRVRGSWGEGWVLSLLLDCSDAGTKPAEGAPATQQRATGEAAAQQPAQQSAEQKVRAEAPTVAPSRQAVANAPSNGECRASSSANVQSGPGPNYAHLRVITRNDVLRVTGKSVDSGGLLWTRVSGSWGEGWVLSLLLDCSDAGTKPAEGAPVTKQRATDEAAVQQLAQQSAEQKARAEPQAVETALALSPARWVLIQRSLAALGYQLGSADGLPGDHTRAAIRRFQHQRGFPETGYLDAQELGGLLTQAHEALERDDAQKAAAPAAQAPTVPPANNARGMNTADGMLQQAAVALARRDYPAAETAARTLLTDYRASPVAYQAQYLLAQALAGEGQHAQAAIAYDDTYNRSRKGSQAAAALIGLARELVAINDKRAACDTLAKAATEFPQQSLASTTTDIMQRAGCR